MEASLSRNRNHARTAGKPYVVSILLASYGSVLECHVLILPLLALQPMGHHFARKFDARFLAESARVDASSFAGVLGSRVDSGLGATRLSFAGQSPDRLSCFRPEPEL